MTIDRLPDDMRETVPVPFDKQIEVLVRLVDYGREYMGGYNPETEAALQAAILTVKRASYGFPPDDGAKAS